MLKKLSGWFLKFSANSFRCIITVILCFFSEKLNVFHKSSLVISLQTLTNPTYCFYCRKFTKSSKSPHISAMKSKIIFHPHNQYIPMYSNDMHIASIAVLRALFQSFGKYFCAKHVSNCWS